MIADHLRATSFLIADGVMPSNEGRGYVLRRIMRRAMRHAHMLGAKEPLMWRLVPVLVAEMGQAFSELVRAEALITEVLRLEETRFQGTLERGLRLLEEATQGLGRGALLPGETAFKLYDTYGFPLDLTEDALRARGMTVDKAGFEAAMARQRAEARASWRGSGEQAEERIWFELRELLGATEFLGYDHDAAEAQVRALLVGGRPVRARRARHRGDGGREPDAVLRRGGRPDRRYRHDPARQGGGRGQGHAEEGRRPPRPHREARGRPARGRRRGRAPDRR